MEIHFRLVGLGWAEATISHEGAEASITASYLGDALGDLVRAAIEVVHGRDEVLCHWWEEPGEYRWLFRLRGDVVNLRIVDVVSSADQPLRGPTLFLADVPVRTLASAVADCANRVLAEYGEDGYDEEWHLAKFPRDELTTLETLVSRVSGDVPTAKNLGVVVTQMPVTWDVERNTERIHLAIEQAEPGDIVLTPEGSLSGYLADGNVDEIKKIDARLVEARLRLLKWSASGAGVELWVGVISRSGSNWVNEAVGMSVFGIRRYRKRNLAHHERSRFDAGKDLPVFRSSRGDVGVQLCREIRFPDQWSALASAGASVFLHLDNGVAETPSLDIWRSMLVARAHETQRWVVSANAAHERQHAPTMVVAPTGVVELELPPGEDLTARVVIDLSQVRDDYLSQRVSTETVRPPP